MNNFKEQFSFTIIELLASITIVVILAAITVGVYSYIRTKSYNDKTIATIKKVEMAIRSFKHDNGYYIQQKDLGSLSMAALRDYLPITKMEGNDEINSSSHHLVDAWGRDILYQCPGKNNTTMFDLISKGKDGTGDDGSGDNITNFTKY